VRGQVIDVTTEDAVDHIEKLSHKCGRPGVASALSNRVSP
jgi:hypothetical protein